MNKAPASKLTLKISLNDDMRRVSHTGALTFENLIATVKKLFSTLTEDEVKSLVVRYQDDEKDWITVSSDEELSEAISLLPSDSPVLRLTLSPSQPKQRHCGGGRGRWHRMMMAQNGCAQPGEEGQKHEGQKHEGWGRCDGNKHEGWKRFWAARHAEQSGEEGQKHEGWGRWRHGEEGKHGGWGGRCGPRGRFFFLQKQGLKLMETGVQANIQAAKILFQEQLTIFEHHTPIYNIACCEALLGNSKDALVFLKKAVDAGFRDVNHIENDADLKSIRHLDEYKAIIASVPAEKPASDSNSSNSSAPVVVPEVKPQPVETPKTEVKSPEIAVPAPSAPSVSAQEASLVALANMGFADRTKNLEALERAKGDIVVAVQLLVDAQRLLYKWF